MSNSVDILDRWLRDRLHQHTFVKIADVGNYLNWKMSFDKLPKYEFLMQYNKQTDLWRVCLLGEDKEFSPLPEISGDECQTPGQAWVNYRNQLRACQGSIYKVLDCTANY